MRTVILLCFVSLAAASFEWDTYGNLVITRDDWNPDNGVEGDAQTVNDTTCFSKCATAGQLHPIQCHALCRRALDDVTNELSENDVDGPIARGVTDRTPVRHPRDVTDRKHLPTTRDPRDVTARKQLPIIPPSMRLGCKPSAATGLCWTASNHMLLADSLRKRVFWSCNRQTKLPTPFCCPLGSVFQLHAQTCVQEIAPHDMPIWKQETYDRLHKLNLNRGLY